MKRLLLILSLFVIIGVQVNAGIEAKAGDMRLLNKESQSPRTENKSARKMRSNNYLRGDYLICVLAIGTYIMIKRRKSRRIDL